MHFDSTNTASFVDEAQRTWVNSPPLAEQCRPDFPLLTKAIDGRRIVYLDSAATSLKPQCVINEVVRYYSEIGANIHRGKHFLSEQASADFEDVRARVAQFTGFLSNEVIFTAGTTAAINLVASGLTMGQGDVVLVPFDAHHSAMLPWRRRADVRYIPVSDSGVVDLDAYEDLLRLKPAVVVLTGCSNVSGVYMPVALMASMAKRVGAITLVDAAQSVGHRRLVTPDVDFLAFSSHKMLGPTGLGVLCGRHEYLRRLAPVQIGGGAVDWVDEQRHDLRKLPYSLEAGTPNISAVYGLGAAIEYLMAIGFDRLSTHDHELGASLAREAMRRSYLRVLGPISNIDRGGILSVSIDGVSHLKEIAQILSDSYSIFCRTGHMCAQPLVDRFTDQEVLRISGYLYNDEADIKAVFSALDEIIDLVRRR
ncbi:aminotransferase class V-fold PLP-dependent enzyme [Burkholderia sp. MBR-1]|uniref:aminotransferase class V-fold PLP-dependent enzyme n=1 Tax=Burkholderia sp. MBR-1 TaxID=2732364 RepID=UPI0015EF9A5F|nr:aminotransferase class V-fold PLP-dependent enzyme [Burkholderia sp. MBR-1]QMI44687.1 aminotransferase class V-fold PLP-dependent enzyme [Burkholderia sp. MBR-1]